MRVLRQHVTAALAAAFALSMVPVLSGQTAVTSQRWVTTWTAAATARIDPAGGQGPAATLGRTLVPPDQIPPAVLAVAPGQQLPIGGQSPLHFNNQTLRQIVHVTAGGSRLRVALTNVFGTVPLTIGAAQVAIRDHDASIVPQSNRALTFDGRATIEIPPGAIMLSDAVNIAVPDFADLAIDIYLPQDTAAMKSPITTHAASWQTNYVSTSGNHAGAATLPVQTTTAYRRADGLPTATWFFLARVEVMAPARTGAVVTFGDSITDGTASGIDANNRWPDQLARRLLSANIRMAVLNAGIGGNRMLGDGNGVSALARFDRDVLAVPGVTHVIVLEGINDIGGARDNPTPGAAELIAAHRQLIDRAHAHGLRIYGATLTPFEGANYYTAAGDAKRQALNNWIRTSKAYDAVLDFDAAVRDPSHPLRTLPQYDAGDHLHLTPAGYRAVADTIDLSLFRPASAAQTAAR
jgi:lysophospholipase L1-like esterase